MTRRSSRPPAERSGRAPADPPERGRDRPPIRPASIALQAALLLGVFAAVTGIALLAGAANLGTAMGSGQIAFAIVLVWLLLRR